MAIATARPTISNAIDALAELLANRAKEYGEADATSEMAIGAKRARRLAILFKRAVSLNAWQLEALLQHAALLSAAVDGVGLSDNVRPTWDDVYESDEPEVHRLETVVHALGFWGDEGIGYNGAG